MSLHALVTQMPNVLPQLSVQVVVVPVVFATLQPVSAGVIPIQLVLHAKLGATGVHVAEVFSRGSVNIHQEIIKPNSSPAPRLSQQALQVEVATHQRTLPYHQPIPPSQPILQLQPTPQHQLQHRRLVRGSRCGTGHSSPAITPAIAFHYHQSFMTGTTLLRRG